MKLRCTKESFIEEDGNQRIIHFSVHFGDEIRIQSEVRVWKSNIYDANIKPMHDELLDLRMAHPNVKQYCYKLVPSFENLMIIIGKDRATGQGFETTKERHIRLEREKEEVNIDDQDPLISIEKETSNEQNEGSMRMQGDETFASKFNYRSSTQNTYAKRKSKAEGFKEEFQMLKNGMDDVASSIKSCASRMVIIEEQLFEEVQRIGGCPSFLK